MAAAKLQRLKLLFGDNELPQRPSSTHPRTIDHELGGLHPNLLQITSQQAEKPFTSQSFQSFEGNASSPGNTSPDQAVAITGNSQLPEDHDIPQCSTLPSQLANRDEVDSARSARDQIRVRETDTSLTVDSSPHSSKEELERPKATDTLSDKLMRLQLLLGDMERPQKPSPTKRRIIDEEMGDFYPTQDQSIAQVAEVPTPPVDHKLVKEVIKADPYDSLDDGSDMDDPFFAACARKEAEKEAKKKRKKKNKSAIMEAQKNSFHSMSSRATDAVGSMSKLKFSEGVTKLGTFCPIHAVAKFPYKHIGKENSEAVADAFFNAGKFWDRTFDV
jgi:hypothetical protein